MIKYNKFQFGWLIVIVFLIIMIWMTFAYIYQWGNNPIDRTGFIIFMSLFGLIFLGFYGMTVIVTDKQIRIKLGVGFYTKKIDLSAVNSVIIQKYPVYYGYGIRIIPNGVLFNVSGNHAVEIRFKDRNKVILIGTDDWENLKDAIEKSIVKKTVRNNLH
jgi:hypothetical protein